MEKRIIKCGLGYDITLGRGLTTAINEILTRDNIFLIVDENISKLYRYNLQVNYNLHKTFVLKSGEKSKNLKTALKVFDKMLAANCDRATTLVTLGGGVAGDLGGFVSSVYMRGINYIQIPTTLLSMVDSSVGGKTGVDLNKFKNIIGSFKQPSAVIADLDFLTTLTMTDIMSGLGEIVKTAILDKALFEYLDKNILSFIGADEEVVANVVEICIKFKSDIVERDEKETGLRKILNLGHTVGHALETLDNYKNRHGFYVLNGIFYELRLARICNCIDESYSKAIKKMLDKVLPETLILKDINKLIEIMSIDKKNKDAKVCFILPVSYGETTEKYFDSAYLKQVLEEMK